VNTVDYSGFRKTPTARAWKKIGLRRRAGVCAPLFSLYSSRSVGIGELPDLKLLVDWCADTGQSVIQLLPLNDVGYDFAPYSAKSSFALDPMYLSLRDLVGVAPNRFEDDVLGLARNFPRGKRVNYGVKGAKAALLWEIFQESGGRHPRFRAFQKKAAYWLKDDALYKVLKGRFQGKNWEEWDDPFRRRDPGALHELAEQEREPLRFQEWLQWQLFEQFRDVKRHARDRDVLLMGDMPFLVARDSADVWAHRDYFNMGLSAGAPPDFYFAGGQRWGMPPYDWPALSARGYDYLIQKLRYAENFYDLFRIDHVIGVFRVYTIPLDSPAERGGLDGVFDPADEKNWEDHGKRLLSVMAEATGMLPCGEDLGAVPTCSNPTLAEFGIPGLEVQRWSRDWGKTYDFTPPAASRKNACAVVSTHDMSVVSAWWNDEAGTVDDYFFRLKCEARGLPYEALKGRLFEPDCSAVGRLRWREEIADVAILLSVLGLKEADAKEFIDVFRGTRDERERFWRFAGGAGKPADKASTALVRRALETAGKSAAIFSVQLLFDWLAAGGGLTGSPRDYRINLPGSVGSHNWSALSPLSLEELQDWPGNRAVRDINRASSRK